MSWKYKTYQSKFYFSEKEIDFTLDYLDYKQFLLQEFFTADLETRNKISNYYIGVYGSRSLAYLQRKYTEWSRGDYHLTDLMKERILFLMPKFLNENAKLKLGIHEFMASIKNTIKLFQSNQRITYRNPISIKKLQDVVSIFEIEYEKIQTLTIKKFRFNILTQEEKDEALEISKYILNIKLQKTFDQIERDFYIFLPYMSKFKRGKFSAKYLITLFNLNVDITSRGNEGVKIPKFKIYDVETNTRFKDYSDKYLAYELTSIHNEGNRAVGDSFLNESDITLFLTHYEELLYVKKEVIMKSTFQGEGGILSIKAQIMPLTLLKKSIAISLIKTSIYFAIIISLFSLVINFKHFYLLIFGSFFFGIIILNLLSQEIKQINSLTKELKEYGK